MPPAPKHNQIVIVLDMKMNQDKAFQILDEIVLHEIATFPKDQYKLIMLHTETTNNSEEYNNIMATGVSNFDLDIKTLIRSVKISDKKANWIEGIDLAVKHLSECEAKNVINKQLILISDFSTPMLNINEKFLNQIIAEINEYFIYFYVIGPEIKHKSMITRNNIEDVMKNINLDKLNDSNLDCAVKIVKECGGIICSPELGLGLLITQAQSFPKQPWKVALSFNDFKFPTICEKIIFKENKFSLENKGKGAVQYMLPSENITDEPKIIENSDVISVCKYLDQIVYIDDVDAMFKFQGEAMFKIIGFVNNSDISEVFFSDEDAYKVRANSEDPNAASFYELVKSTAEKNKYIIALKSHFKNAAPKQFILVPRPPSEFIMIAHPELVGQNCVFTKPNDKTVSPPELLNGFKKHLEGLSSNLLELHPSASVGCYTTNYYKCIMDVVEKREPKEEKKIYELGAFAEMVLKYKPLEKVGKAALNKGGNPMKVDDDDDDGEDW